MRLTRPQAISRRMDAAAHGLQGAIANLARMLAIVEFEHDEDIRVFGCSRSPAPHYVNLREAARRAVDEAGAPAAPEADGGQETPTGETLLAERWPAPTTGTATATIIVFRTFSGEPTATFANRCCAGRVPCFSTRDGHFDAPLADVERWPNAEPTRQLLTELADNFWPD